MSITAAVSFCSRFMRLLPRLLSIRSSANTLSRSVVGRQAGTSIQNIKSPVASLENALLRGTHRSSHVENALSRPPQAPVEDRLHVRDPIAQCMSGLHTSRQWSPVVHPVRESLMQGVAPELLLVPGSSFRQKEPPSCERQVSDHVVVIDSPLISDIIDFRHHGERAPTPREGWLQAASQEPPTATGLCTRSTPSHLRTRYPPHARHGLRCNAARSNLAAVCPWRCAAAPRRTRAAGRMRQRLSHSMCRDVRSGLGRHHIPGIPVVACRADRSAQRLHIYRSFLLW